MNSNDIRQAFIDFFVSKGHTAVPSSSLIPGNDPTLLFTNAGMVPFKEMFLGQETRGYTRAVSSQRCVRAGGKHNDLENVGYTARHHTFFEMLGNFSFGDYFKKEAIAFAWEFITEVLGIPAEKLWVSVYEKDLATAEIWKQDIGVDPSRISFCGEKDNFWTMGDTGPCGPCTEIFYDHGEAIAGGPPGSPDEDGDRYIEIWNLVFTQYDRSKDGTLAEIPNPCVDTGMGLERLTALLQGVHNNYDTDLFQGIIQAAAKLAGVSPEGEALTSLRVIADHIRSTSFLIMDGVVPSNEGRGYVLRRIIRRAIRHGSKIGMPELFFHQLVAPLVAQMGQAYPELAAAQGTIEAALKQEEEQFLQTLAQGLRLLEKALEEVTADEIPGEVVFKLYDTYGFPADLTADIAREKSLSIDEAGFEACMERQRSQSRQANQFDVDYSAQTALLESLKPYETHFVGYEALSAHAKVVAIIKADALVPSASMGESIAVVLDQTPFYAESGGQVGDQGVLSTSKVKMLVRDTQKAGAAFLHVGKLSQGSLKVGDELSAEVDEACRLATQANHSATHLLHHVLQQVLGSHVEQKGSYVAPDRLRFDFTHAKAMTKEELLTVEWQVNALVRENASIDIKEMALDEAKAAGAEALFGEKYGERVRTIRLGDSFELCGGTHVKGAGDIGYFKLTSETGIAAGIRRIEAVTGEGALQWLQQSEEKHLKYASQQAQKLRELEKEIKQLKSTLASQQGSDLASQAVDLGGVKLLVAKLEGVDPKSLRETVDQLKNSLGSAIVVLGCENDKGGVNLIAGVSADLTKKIKAGEVVNVAAAKVGGKGGGRPDMAQAGGSEPALLDAALALVQPFVEQVFSKS